MSCRNAAASQSIVSIPFISLVIFETRVSTALEFLNVSLVVLSHGREVLVQSRGVDLKTS